MKKALFTILFALFSAPLLFLPAMADSATEKRGELRGGVIHEAPSWFKDSFLEIRDDVDEATEEGKHVILFFQLNGCPYCDRMLTESFEADPSSSYIQEHFDTIAINVAGDRDVAFNEEISVTEKELSEILEVRATPAVLFLDSNNKTVARVDGYRAPQRFDQVLQYVSGKFYQEVSLAQYMHQNLARNIYELRDSDVFDPVTDLSSVSGPLAVIFEDSACYDCDEFHDRLLTREDVRQEMAPFTLVRLDTDSEQEIVDIDGTVTTAKAIADRYQVIYRPAVLMFDNGQLVRRYDSLLFRHHFKEGFRYVAGGYYKSEDYSTYSEKRTEELLSQGIDINLGD